MAKASKKNPKPKKPSKYDEPFKIDLAFEEAMKKIADDANEKTKKQKGD
ncbi:MAG: hypothetical protein JSS82_05980 [Bacteroidetes bacterium]|nr:hypothetical protein [Bacteroidota bacterium]